MVTPMPPAPTGVADYVVNILPELQKRFDVHLYSEEQSLLNPPTSSGRWIYQLANNPCHELPYRMARKRPGLVVLHDLPLHYLVYSITLARGDKDALFSELREVYGESKARWVLAEVTQGHLRPLWDLTFRERLLRESLGVLVHSQFAATLLRDTGYEGPLWLSPMPYDPALLATDASPVQARRSLGLPEDAFIVACYGFVAKYKRIDVAVRSFRKLKEHVPEALLLIAGKVQEEYSATFSSLVDPSKDRVVCTGSLGPEKWLQAIRACDVCINLRYPTIGESSAVLSTLLAAGKPVMVSDVGSYAELPSGVVAKVDVGGEEAEEAGSLLVRWALDDKFRRGMEEQAKMYALKTMSPAAVAEVYSQAMKSL